MTKITEVTIIPVKPKNGLVALASCVIDDKLYLGSIGVYTKLSGGYRLTFPNKKVGTNSLDIYHPINREFSGEMEKAVIARYEELMEGSLGINHDAD